MKRILILLLLSLASAPSVWANDFDEYFEKGNVTYQQGNYPKAIEYYEQAVNLDPNSAAVYNALGLTYQAINANLSDTVWLFEVATEIDPQYADAYHNLCRTLYQAGEYEPAEKACLDALAINPSLGNVHLSLAWLYLVGLSNPPQSIQYFHKVLDRVKKPMIYFGLGLAYSKNGENAKVLETVTTLRAMGEEAYASKLEASVRSGYVYEPQETEIAMPQRQPGVLVGAGTPPQGRPQQTAQGGGGGGSMRIRLKGSMTGGQTTVSSPEGAAGSSSAIERIRALQRMRQ